MGRIGQEFREGWNDFWSAVTKAAKETPVGFFAPAIWTWKFLVRVNRQLWERYEGKGRK
jgi:hypothetical protein